MQEQESQTHLNVLTWRKRFCETSRSAHHYNGADTSLRANGLLDCFQRGRTVLGLIQASEGTWFVECRSKPLHKQTCTIAGDEACCRSTSSHFKGKWMWDKFQDIFHKNRGKGGIPLGLDKCRFPT